MTTDPTRAELAAQVPKPFYRNRPGDRQPQDGDVTETMVAGGWVYCLRVNDRWRLVSNVGAGHQHQPGKVSLYSERVADAGEH